MTVQNVADLFAQAAALLQKEETRLCEIDAETGDGDHGVAIARVAEAIVRISRERELSGLEEYFSAVSNAIMSINGGSCIPLWANMFDGMAQAAAELDDDPGEGIRQIFRGALEGVGFISDAVPGEKTMVDALEPAVSAAQACEGDICAILSTAAQAAALGAEKTRNMVARYGRAKNLKDDSRGHLDAGAVSVSIFIDALSRCAAAQ